jgi:hypothetical protein
VLQVVEVEVEVVVEEAVHLVVVDGAEDLGRVEEQDIVKAVEIGVTGGTSPRESVEEEELVEEEDQMVVRVLVLDPAMAPEAVRAARHQHLVAMDMPTLMVRAVVVAKVVAQMGLAGPELVLALVRDTVRVA